MRSSPKNHEPQPDQFVFLRGKTMRMQDAFIGSWRITDTEVWDRESIDLSGPAYIKFDRNGMGEFAFIAVRGSMDCRFSQRDGKPLAEFSWLGSDELDDASGRGWAVVEDDGKLSGRVYFHLGEDSAFSATRTSAAANLGGRKQRGPRSLSTLR
jgi:hypothetical protein